MYNPWDECPCTDCPTCGADEMTLKPCPKCNYDAICQTCGYCTNPDCFIWVMFTRRTDDPKLKWLEGELDKLNIPHRRKGSTGHAPILEVPDALLGKAWSVLERPYGQNDVVDNVPDDDPMFQES
jgi:hypothetical protein